MTDQYEPVLAGERRPERAKGARWVVFVVMERWRQWTLGSQRRRARRDPETLAASSYEDGHWVLQQAPLGGLLAYGGGVWLASRSVLTRERVPVAAAIVPPGTRIRPGETVASLSSWRLALWHRGDEDSLLDPTSATAISVRKAHDLLGGAWAEWVAERTASHVVRLRAAAPAIAADDMLHIEEERRLRAVLFQENAPLDVARTRSRETQEILDSASLLAAEAHGGLAGFPSDPPRVASVRRWWLLGLIAEALSREDRRAPLRGWQPPEERGITEEFVAVPGPGL